MLKVVNLPPAMFSPGIVACTSGSSNLCTENFVFVQIVGSWQEIDPDEYSYEELVALGGVVSTESRGLSADTLASLPSVTYNTKDMQDGNTEQCVICHVGLEEGESLVALPYKHS
ncbi:unnamed protein product [Triticum turgidum subsp. durum]|uniref:Uncharacterized protein n=2 Tax=Triticum TaxID=4564 RepID=A0A9R0WPL8_TRITD|nr:unnamed protein product [Triticum turgidum subsp. durum]